MICFFFIFNETRNVLVLLVFVFFFSSILYFMFVNKISTRNFAPVVNFADSFGKHIVSSVSWWSFFDLPLNHLWKKSSKHREYIRKTVSDIIYLKKITEKILPRSLKYILSLSRCDTVLKTLWPRPRKFYETQKYKCYKFLVLIMAFFKLLITIYNSPQDLID